MWAKNNIEPGMKFNSILEVGMQNAAQAIIYALLMNVVLLTYVAIAGHK